MFPYATLFSCVPQHCLGTTSTSQRTETMEDKANYADDEERNPDLPPVDSPDGEQCSALASGETCTAGRMSSPSPNVFFTTASNSRNRLLLSSHSSSPNLQDGNSYDAYSVSTIGGDIIAGSSNTSSDVIPPYMTVDFQGKAMERKDASGAGMPLAVSKYVQGALIEILEMCNCRENINTFYPQAVVHSWVLIPFPWVNT